MACCSSDWPTPLVIDHMDCIDPAERHSSVAFSAVRPLLNQDNTWVKLSGMPMCSQETARAMAIGNTRSPEAHS
jgi:predicted TIM-barrel fold metal-dependent hydrolase